MQNLGMVSDLENWMGNMFAPKQYRRLTKEDYDTLKSDDYKNMNRAEAYQIFNGLWINPKQNNNQQSLINMNEAVLTQKPAESFDIKNY